jgi:hypothetical protein
MDSYELESDSNASTSSMLKEGTGGADMVIAICACCDAVKIDACVCMCDAVKIDAGREMAMANCCAACG